MSWLSTPICIIRAPTCALARVQIPPRRSPRGTAFDKLLSLSFEVSLSELQFRVPADPCATIVSVTPWSVAVRGHPERCTLSDEQLTTVAPALFRAGAELIGDPTPPKLYMNIDFTSPPIIEKWLPVMRAPGKVPAKPTHAQLGPLMLQHRVFEHVEPFIAEIGYRIESVSMEKLSSERGDHLVQKRPSLATVGLTARARVVYPMLTTLVLVR